MQASTANGVTKQLQKRENRIRKLEAAASKIARKAGSASCSFNHATWHAALLYIITECEQVGFDILGDAKRK